MPTTVPTLANYKRASAEAHRLQAEFFDAQERADQILVAMGYSEKRWTEHNRAMAASYRKLSADCLTEAQAIEAEDARRAASELADS